MKVITLEISINSLIQLESAVDNLKPDTVPNDGQNINENNAQS